jgi:hypothetical protein
MGSLIVLCKVATIQDRESVPNGSVRQHILLVANMDLLFRGERNLPTLRIDRPEALHADRVEGPIVIYPTSKPRLIRTHGLSVSVPSGRIDLKTAPPKILVILCFCLASFLPGQERRR